MVWFDESRLDDDSALAGVEPRLRHLAESGARVRREALGAQEPLLAALANSRDQGRPRAVIAAGPDSRLLRAVLEPWCPVPFVAWPGPSLPGWAGSLDLVVVLAPDGGDHGTAAAVAEAVRRGCQVVAACPPRSLVAEHAEGRWVTVLPTVTGDQLAAATVALVHLSGAGLGPEVDPEEVARELDGVAVACGPRRDLAVNPGKMLAIALADTTPVVWGGSVLAARAARRVAEQLRRATGRSAVAGDAEHLLPIISAAGRRDVFADPVADPGAEPRPLLLVLEDGTEDPIVRQRGQQLRAAADERGVRVESVAADTGCDLARYASLVLTGTYAADYLALGLVEE